MAKKQKVAPGTIARNKRAKFEFHIEDKLEAGIALTGWEVKALRESKCQLTESYVFVKNGEAFISGMSITPLKTVSTHVVAEPTRVRKLLLHRREIARIIGATQAKGQTCVALSIYWKNNLVKLEIALAAGKKSHDKRASIKERDWNRDKARVMKAHNT
jgi:SsrA-binding protein